MDRREALALLGLHEDATRTQIDEAYSTWAKKYKAADYADEPEYARRKLALLKEAYSIATGSVAPSSGRSVRDEHRSERRSETRAERSRPERLSKHTTSDCDEHGSGLGKLKSLKSGYETTRKTFSQKFEEFKKEVAEYRAEDADMEAEEFLTDGEERGGGFDEERRERRSGGFDEYVQIAEPIGGSKAAGTGRGTADGREKKNVLNQILTFLSIVLVLVSIGTTIYNSDSSSVTFETGEESMYVSSVDQDINDTAEELSVVYDGVMPYDSVSEESYTEERFDDLLDQFTNVYTYGEYISFDDWLDQLRAAYPGWLADSYEMKEDAFRDVLLLFEFPDYENCLGVENPGNGEPIKSMADYVQFLIDFKG